MLFSCVFVTFPYGVLGRVWYLIVLFPDICVSLYFKHFHVTDWTQFCDGRRSKGIVEQSINATFIVLALSTLFNLTDMKVCKYISNGL